MELALPCAYVGLNINKKNREEYTGKNKIGAFNASKIKIIHLLLTFLSLRKEERDSHNSYLQKDTSILDKRMVMQISSWREY